MRFLIADKGKSLAVAYFIYLGYYPLIKKNICICCVHVCAATVRYIKTYCTRDQFQIQSTYNNGLYNL